MVERLSFTPAFEATRERRQRNEELERLTLLEERAEHFTKSQYIYNFIAEIEEQESELDLTNEEK